MINYLKEHEWKIIETNYDPAHMLRSESIFSIGNGKMGQRANFEEDYSGPSLRGSYNAGIYYPDKTRVGWWKNGYPEYFAKVLNSVNWIGMSWNLNGETLDLNQCDVLSFKRELDMQNGLLSRFFEVRLSNGLLIQANIKRFVSMADDRFGTIQYELMPLNGELNFNLSSYLDFDVHNSDSNYDEVFWEKFETREVNRIPICSSQTRKTGFKVVAAMQNTLETEGVLSKNSIRKVSDKKIEEHFEGSVSKGQKVTIVKSVGILNSLLDTDMNDRALLETLSAFHGREFRKNYDRHKNEWADIWKTADIQIEGDVRAQQGIRFNIFQLYQTYTGKYDQLNIGPKGFTGEKYGGATYWDTEAYCLPFYMSTASKEVALQLLLYRYNQLDKAIENAEKLGFTNGAALYPMVTMNGEECHNEWEITFEEIHRNGAIAYAIYNYTRYTGDDRYLHDKGIEVLIAISRFWVQRVNWSSEKKKYVMLGVTGPNEYENNINNNWYTNYLAKWTIDYTLSVINDLDRGFIEDSEKEAWTRVSNGMYFPEENGVFLQQDGFLDKDLSPASEIPKDQRPINQHWSWDRILRSVYIKQADVLQGLYFFEDHFKLDTLSKNFDFYEPLTVHESSLSPCVHSILAARIGQPDKAYQLYLNTSRLDLDDYNNEVHEGLHITSMAGTWMSVVQGFGGLRIEDNMLVFRPMIPHQWSSFTFKVLFRNRLLSVHISNAGTDISLEKGSPVMVKVNDEVRELK
jgi:maltose phosphorylase